jgi:enoyl-CoA hydratase/carnithine racemase
MEDIIAELGADDSVWASETLDKLYAVSPTSLKVTLRHLKGSAGLDFARVMTMEYRLSQAFVRSHDTYEGIRAALIDKDRAPKWRPARLADVSDALVEEYFAPRPGDELHFG